MTSPLASPPSAPPLRLERLGNRHRDGLRAACAADDAIWAIYPTSWDRDHFDRSFDALIGNPARLPFAIVASEAVVGMTAYIGHDPVRGVVEIGNTFLSPHARGTGLNGTVKRLLIDHAFRSGIRRIEFRVDAINGRSLAAVTKLGAVREGVLRAERITWTGRVRDTVLFSILADEWPPANAS